jgi:hypothetical protein
MCQTFSLSSVLGEGRTFFIMTETPRKLQVREHKGKTPISACNTVFFDINTSYEIKSEETLGLFNNAKKRKKYALVSFMITTK